MPIKRTSPNHRFSSHSIALFSAQRRKKAIRSLKKPPDLKAE